MKKSRRNTIIIAVLFIILVSCEKSLFEEYEPELNVFAVLSNKNLIHEVIVDRTYKMDEPSEMYVGDALVILSGHNVIDTLEFHEFISFAAYHTDEMILEPSALYELTVIKEGFDTVIAQTKIPGDFSIVYPHYNDTLTISDTIILTKSSGAPYYYGYFIDVNDYKIPFWYVPDTLDSLVRIPIPFYLTFAYSGYYTIEILACDENYYQYSQFKPDQDSVLQAGVNGGVGVFASYQIRYEYVYLVLE